MHRHLLHLVIAAMPCAALAISDDTVLVHNGTTYQSKALLDCDGLTDAVQYDRTTNNFSCRNLSLSGLGGAPVNAAYLTNGANGILTAEVDITGTTALTWGGAQTFSPASTFPITAQSTGDNANVIQLLESAGAGAASEYNRIDFRDDTGGTITQRIFGPGANYTTAAEREDLILMALGEITLRPNASGADTATFSSTALTLTGDLTVSGADLSLGTGTAQSISASNAATATLTISNTGAGVMNGTIDGDWTASGTLLGGAVTSSGTLTANSTSVFSGVASFVSAPVMGHYDMQAQSTAASNPASNEVRFYVREDIDQGAGTATADCAFVARLQSAVEVLIVVLATDAGCP